MVNSSNRAEGSKIGFVTDLASGTVVGDALGLESSGEEAARAAAAALEASGQDALG